MDTRKLKVGQYVRIDGETQSCLHQGKITKVTDHGVEVLEEDFAFLGPMWFNSDGKRVWFGSNGPEQELTPVPHFVKTLAVGQTIELASRFFRSRATVLEINPTDIIVREQNPKYPNKIRFDINGRAMDSRDLGHVDYGCSYCSNSDYLPGSYEGGPWYIR